MHKQVSLTTTEKNHQRRWTLQESHVCSWNAIRVSQPVHWHWLVVQLAQHPINERATVVGWLHNCQSYKFLSRSRYGRRGCCTAWLTVLHRARLTFLPGRALLSEQPSSLRGIKRLPCRLTDDCTDDSYYLETAASRQTAASQRLTIQLAACVCDKVRLLTAIAAPMHPVSLSLRPLLWLCYGFGSICSLPCNYECILENVVW